MYANVVLGLRHDLFEEALEIAKEDKGVHLDTELEAEDWERLAARYRDRGPRVLRQRITRKPAGWSEASDGTWCDVRHYDGLVSPLMMRSKNNPCLRSGTSYDCSPSEQLK